MVSSIHSRENAQSNRVEEKNSGNLRREAEFAAVLESVSKPKTPSREERIHRAVSNASQKYQLPPGLILAVIKQESNFNPVAESHCGAQGLMQLMPGTARTLGVTDSFDIDQNVDGGARYLREMLDRFGGDVRLALAAYNAGPGRVEQYQGIPPIEETRNYVPSVLVHYESFNGNGSPNLEIPSSRSLDLELVAFAASSVMTQEILATSPSIPMPEIKKSGASDEPPPPPPPTAVRV